MTTIHDLFAPTDPQPWAPDLRVVRKALSLRTGWVALTRIVAAGARAHAFHLPAEVDEAVAWVVANAGADVTLTWSIAELTLEGAERINESRTATGVQKPDIAGYGWVAADLDPDDVVTMSVYRDRLTRYGITPSLVLASGRGLHVFWKLKDWTVAPLVLPTLEDLVRVFDSDTGTLDPNRNLRLPGTWNAKAEARRLAVVETYDPHAAYTLEELSARACALSPRPERVRTARQARVLADGEDWPDRYRASYDLADELTRITGATGGSRRKWPCPAGHPGDGPPSLTLHPDNDQRAVCHGTAHPHDMGRQSGGRYTFDVLDLHAMEVGQTVEDFMRDERRRQQPQDEQAGTAPGGQGGQEGQSSTPPPAEDWPDPAPLTTTPPPVDVSGLPAVLADIVREVASSAQAPVEVPLVFALGALSAATRGCWDITITSSWKGEPTALYGVTLADSGERKSAGKNPITRALDEAEKRVALLVRAENRDRDPRRKAADARRRQAEKDGDEDGAAREAARVHELRPRPVPALVLSDTTTEALGVNMEEQGGAAALFITEATAFSTVAGHYNNDKSGSGGNVGLLNHAYDAERYADKRIKRGGVTIPRPFLAWAAAVQTQVLTGYANGTTEGSGFLARFVLLLPTSMVGYRKVRTEAVPAAVQRAWDEALTALHSRAWEHYKAMTDDPDEYGEPLPITLTPAASDLLLDYYQRLEDGKRTDLDLRDLGGWIEKHPARLARMAALFALLENPYTTAVEVPHVRAALTLADPLVEHATAALRVLRNTGDSGPVRRVLDALTSLGQTVVTTREVLKKVHGQGWVSGVEAVRAVLAELAELDYLRPDQAKTGGRPSERWHVHPSLLTGTPDAEGQP